MTKSAASTLLLRKIQWRKMHGKDPLILPCSRAEFDELQKILGKPVDFIYGCKLQIVSDSAFSIVLDCENLDCVAADFKINNAVQ